MFWTPKNHQFLLEVKLMNDQLLDTMQEKQRPFKQIEAIKKEATFPVDDAIRRTISSHAEIVEALKKEATFPVDDAIKSMKSSPNDLCQRALELGNNWSEEVKRLVESYRLHEARQFLDAVSQTLGPSDKLAYWQRVLAKTKVLPGTPASSVGNFANAAWLRHHARQYQGQWIALREGVLLGAHKNHRELSQQLRDSGTEPGAMVIKLGG
jgi:hypothetical protein